MANLKASFSPKEFELAIAHEETVGTATSTLTNFKLLNIDSIEMPSLNPQQILDVRHGAGRTLKEVDLFLTNDLTVKEISFSGIADATVLPLLLKNITQTSNVASLHIPASYDPSELKVGDAGADAGTSTFSVLLGVPESNNSMLFTACVLTSLTLNGDIAEESGRIKMSGTFKTGKKPSFTDNNNPSDTSHFNTNYFVTDYEGTNAAQVIAGLTSPIMKSFSCTLDNDAQFMGFDSSGNYQIIARALPEAMVTFDSVIKYDADTDGLVATFEGQDGSSTVANTLTGKDGATRNVDISIPKSVITDVSFSEEEAMFLSVSTRGVAGTSGNLVAFTIQ